MGRTTDGPGVGVRLALVTPTWAGDLERFLFLRESIVRCGITLPHVAVVHTEDLRTFEAIPFSEGLTLIPTAEVLPAKLERRRRAGRILPRSRVRLTHGHRAVDGRWTQQITKLAVADVIGAESVACVDSDVFFVRSISEVDFFDRAGRLHLHEPEGLSVLLLGWLARSANLLQLPLGDPLMKISAYQSQVVPIHGGVVRDMRRYIERLHGKPWFDAMFRADVVEYTTYGVYARYVDELRRVSPIWSSLCVSFHTPQQFAVFPEYFPRRVEEVDARAGMIHGELGLPVEAYRPVVEQIWSMSTPSSSRE